MYNAVHNCKMHWPRCDLNPRRKKQRNYFYFSVIKNPPLLRTYHEYEQKSNAYGRHVMN